MRILLTKMEIRKTYLVRIWYVLTLVFAFLNTPFGTYLARICFSKYVLRILIAYFRFFNAYFSLGYAQTRALAKRDSMGSEMYSELFHPKSNSVAVVMPHTKVDDAER